jgi:hypothetical protein
MAWIGSGLPTVSVGTYVTCARPSDSPASGVLKNPITGATPGTDRARLAPRRTYSGGTPSSALQQPTDRGRFWSGAEKRLPMSLPDSRETELKLPAVRPIGLYFET